MAFSPSIAREKDMMPRVWFVDSEKEAEDAVEKLWYVPRSGGQRLLSVHLEGVSVGYENGFGTLLTIASLYNVSGERNIVMFDVKSCPKIWTIVSGLLQTPMIRKVFHSCINDLFELQVQRNITVRNAYDIAVADYVIRWQKDRTVVPEYRSLSDLVYEYGRGRVSINDPVTASIVGFTYGSTKSVWTKRPLSQDLKAFAAADVHIALMLYVRMVSLVRRDVGREMMETIMWERLNVGRYPDIVKQSQKQRERERVRNRRSGTPSDERAL